MNNPEVRNAAKAQVSSTRYNIRPNNDLLYDIAYVEELERQTSSTHNSLSSLEGNIYEESCYGTRLNEKMSAVRRFFCLFVLFDLLLIGLIWIICIMLKGSDVIQILKEQVIHYSLKTSLFDVVLAALCRFTVLLLFYGLFQLNTTFFVALSTLGTCVFLILKVIYYSWNTEPAQPATLQAFQVFLVIISFVIAWGETWFLDFRVLPQEYFALNYAQTARVSDSLNNLLPDRTLRAPLMRHFLQFVGSGEPETESVGNFYTPQGSPDGSDDEYDDQKAFRTDCNLHYLRKGEHTMKLAWFILNDKGWKLQKKSPEGDYIYSKNVFDKEKMFLLRTNINIDAKKLLDELFENVDRYHLWNKSLIESRRVHRINEHADITYQVSNPGGNGAISSRDFVNLRYWDKKENAYALAATSTTHDSVPRTKEYIRGENGICCWVMRPLDEGCTFEFLLHTDLKGWIPKYVLDNALVNVLQEYASSLKEYCNNLKKLENT